MDSATVQNVQQSEAQNEQIKGAGLRCPSGSYFQYKTVHSELLDGDVSVSLYLSD